MSESPVREQRLVVMVSGNGSNLQAVLDACADGRINGRVVAVVSNKADVFALQRADTAGVPAVHIGPHQDEERTDYDARLTELVAGFDPDFIVLAGWLRILTLSFLGWFPGRVINLHPAKPGELPGLRAIERAWAEAIDGVRSESGVMVQLRPRRRHRRRPTSRHRSGVNRRIGQYRTVRGNRACRRAPAAGWRTR